MRAIGVFVRSGVLVVAVLTVAAAAAIARPALPLFDGRGAKVVIRGARPFIQVSMMEVLVRLRARGGARHGGRCVVPSLVDYRLSEAVSLLGRAGCRLAMSRKHRGEASWVVVAQSVRPGTRLARGAIVSVRIVSPRVAAKRCVPSPVQRKVIGDSELVIFSELLKNEAIQRREIYLACAYGQSGPHVTKPAMEPWSASWGCGGGGGTVELLVAAGPYLAWQSTSAQCEHASAWITVLDVPEDRVIAEKTISPFMLISESEARALDIALDPEGHVAWLMRIPVHGGSSQPQFTEAVEIIGENGQAITLESGPLGSFEALSFGPPGTLHWSRSGTAQTYMFPR
jgi:hypothetical protein